MAGITARVCRVLAYMQNVLRIHGEEKYSITGYIHVTRS